jgi:hypothetical protein
MLDALIIAPEITKGMKSLGSKALLNIKNSVSILDFQISELKKINKNIKIFIATGFESEKIKKISQKYSNVTIIENTAYETSNQAKCLSLFTNEYESHNLLVVSNGILFKNNALQIVSNDVSKIFVIDKPKNNFTIGCNTGQSVNYLFYDLPIPWSECIFLDRQAIESLRDIIIKHNINQLYLFEIINLMIDKYHVSFKSVEIAKKNIMKINTIKDIPKAKLFI